MESINHISNFSCNEFITKFYSPLCLCFVDSKVSELFEKSFGTKFLDFFSAISTRLNPPLRIVDGTETKGTTDNDFFERVQSQITEYGKSFVNPEFEERGRVDTSLKPKGGDMPRHIKYQSKHAMNPPWYRLFLQTLVNSNRYSDFEFCNLPIGIIYVTTTSSSSIKRKDIYRMIPYPEWMVDFVTELPILNLFIYDSTVDKSTPRSFVASLDYEMTQIMGFGSKQSDDNYETNKKSLESLFPYNSEIVDSILQKKQIGQTEITSTRSMLEVIRRDFVMPNIQKNIIELQTSVDKSKKMSNVIKGFFKKKTEPEPLTKVLGIPIKKINILYLASLFMINGSYPEAQTYFKMFEKSKTILKNPQLSLIRLRSILNNLFCSFITNNQINYSSEFKYLMDNISMANSATLMIKLSLLPAEFCFVRYDYQMCSYFLETAIYLIKTIWKGNVPVRDMILGIVYERLASITKDRNHSLLYYANAVDKFMSARQYGHALRCIIWLEKNLPESSWPLLYQESILHKANALALSKECIRSLQNSKKLLEMENIQPAVQQQAILQFWTPFNDPVYQKSNQKIAFSTLLSIQKISTVTPHDPVYWGFNRSDFKDITKAFKEIVEKEEKRNSTQNLTYHDWMSDQEKKLAKPLQVSTNSKITINVQLVNRYIFTVCLENAYLMADYEGKYDVDPKFTTSTIPSLEIPGQYNFKSKKNDTISFDFTPHCPGVFNVNKLHKNYWGYIDTQIPLGPLRIEVSDDFPQISMSITGLPEKTYQGSCIKFFITLTNGSNYEADDILIAFDHQHSIAYDEGTILHESKIGMIKLEDSLKPKETRQIPMIFRAAKMNQNDVHFMVASSLQACCFAVAKVNVVAAAKISSSVITNPIDTSNRLLKVKFTALVDDLEIAGIVNSNCRILKTLQSNTNSLIKKNSFSTIIAFSKEETEKKVEEWRQYMMGEACYSLLFKVPGLDLYAQQNLMIDDQQEQRFTLLAQNKSNEPLGTRIPVKIKSYEKECIYIQPSTIEQMNDEKGVQRTLVSSAKWLGKTRVFLNEENNYEAEFSFIALQPGIYVIPGFIYSKNEDFSDVKNINLRHTIHISPE